MVAPLAVLLRYSHPNAIPGDDFMVSRELDGSETIARWNTAKLGTKPTSEALIAAHDAQATTDETSRLSNSAAQIREIAVFAELTRRLRNAGWTADMAFTRLLIDTITRVPNASRTQREKDFMAAVNAANNAIP